MRMMPWALVAAALISTPALAAGIEVTAFVGYRFGGELDGIATAPNPELEESESFGLIADFPMFKNDTSLELLYSHQSTDLVASGVFGSPELLPIEIDFFQIGVIKEWDRRHIRPFFAATAGLLVAATGLAPGGFGAWGLFRDNLETYVADFVGIESVDLSAYAGTTGAIIRFQYISGWDWWWLVDNVSLVYTATATNRNDLKM